MLKLNNVELLVKMLSDRLDHVAEVVDGGVRICFTPQVAPKAYFHIIYAPLERGHIEEITNKIGIVVLPQYYDFLTIANGVRLFGGALSLYGCLTSVSRSVDGLGQPISIRYGNIVERPANMLADDFVIGGYALEDMTTLIIENAQGEIRMTASKDAGIIYQKWCSLDDFILAEIPRLSSFFDRSGNFLYENLNILVSPSEHKPTIN